MGQVRRRVLAAERAHARDAEVEDLDDAPPSRRRDEEQVRRLHVAMHDVRRVRDDEPLARLRREPERDVHRQRAEPVRDRADVLAVEPVDDHERLAGRRRRRRRAA